MRPGSVIVDLAADAGGNCAATVPGERIVTPNGVTILGYHNWPGRIPVAASSLYARNLLTFLTTFWDKEAQGAEAAGERRHRERRHADPRRRRRASAASCPPRPPEPRRADADEPEPNWPTKPTRLARQASALAAHAHALTGGHRPRHRHRGRAVHLPAGDLPDGLLRRLLRGVERHPGAALAADGGDQRDLLGDRRRRHAGDRARHQRLGDGVRLHRGHAGER